jgi:predicted P-loop ATPase
VSVPDADAFLPIARASSRASDSWQYALIKNRDLQPKPILANAITALRSAPEWQGVLAYDEFSMQTVARACPPWTDARAGNWTDQEDLLTTDWLQHHGILVSTDVTAQAVQAVAREQSFHPVREYLGGLKWDGSKRIDDWLVLYFGAEPSDYARAVGRRWLISAVARIYSPGCKADAVLILEGLQGLGKSSALRALAGPWFTDEIADFGSKDAAMQTRGVWIIEIAELASMTRADVGRVKAFMSRNEDRFRPPYGRRLVASPRQCVFAGSANHSNYLRDETGGRRFWPIHCSQILLDELRRDRSQLWAEAVHEYRANAPWWLDSKELTLVASEEQQARYEGDPWDGPIQAFIQDRDVVSMEELLETCLGKTKGTWSLLDKTRVGRSLKSMGWEKFRKREGSQLPYRYRRVT